MFSLLILRAASPNALPTTKSSLKSFNIGICLSAFGTICSTILPNSLPRSSLSNASVNFASGASLRSALIASFCDVDICPLVEHSSVSCKFIPFISQNDSVSIMLSLIIIFLNSLGFLCALSAFKISSPLFPLQSCLIGLSYAFPCGSRVKGFER